MNSSHFTAIVRMRWRMMRNRLQRSGRANEFITLILLALAALGSLGSFVFAIAAGGLFLAMIEPVYVMYVWDVLAGVFLFAWAVGLMVELQRSEMLSLKNLLHLPISLSGAFFLNYTSSLASLTVLFFLPGMLGLCAASVLYFGGKSLVVFALLIAFLFMVTGVSYQLRGWLARLMENKRTRGTVIVVTTIVFIAVFQIPTLINLGVMSPRWEDSRERLDVINEFIDDLEERKDAGEIEPEDYAAWVRTHQADRADAERRVASRDSEITAINRTATLVNAVLPIGWLPYGAGAAARGAAVSPWLCVLGMSAIGLVSLVLSYRSTLLSYTGEHNKQYRPAARKAAKGLARESILEKSIPFLTDRQSVVTLATLRSMLRAPEGKMALLTPLIFVCVFGSMLLTREMDGMPDLLRPWIGIGALGMSLIGMVQLLLNIFGLDRQGFRAYVLMPAPRRDILLGKNLGIVPIVGTLSALLIAVVGIVGQAQLTHIVATVLQIGVACCVYFPIGNFCSIVAPIGMAVGSMRPVSMKFSVILTQLAAMLLLPLAIVPAAFSLAIEQLVSALGGIRGVPIYLVLTLIELPLAIWFYHAMLNVQGRHLQDREQAILEVISQVAD